MITTTTNDVTGRIAFIFNTAYGPKKNHRLSHSNGFKQSIFFLIALLIGISGFSQSTFIVNSTGTTPSVDAAIEYTTDLWSQYLNSEVPIEINLTFANYASLGFLGQCLPNTRQNFAEAPLEDVWYLSSLANSMTGVDVAPGEVDMDIFVTNTANWYFGTDGNCPSTQYDFVSMLLHEIGHGLGFISLGDYANGIGSIGYLDTSVFLPTSFAFPESFEGHPANYDLFLVNGLGLYIADTLNFENNSAALGNEMVSNDLFFNGPTATSANDGNAPKIFTPANFLFGSSLHHVDENSFPLSSGNSLMTPYAANGEVEHIPGDVTLGILIDLGWSVNLTVGVEEQSIASIGLYPNPSYGTINIDVDTKSTNLIMVDMLGNVVVDQLVAGMNHLDDLSNGTYLVTGTVDDAHVSERIVLIH